MLQDLLKNASSRIKVGNRFVGEGEPTFFIAEIGNNHNGDYYLAKRLVEEAAACGADAVKFQKRFVEEVFAKELLEKPQDKDQIYGKTYGEYRKNLELDEEAFIKLKELSDQLGLVFFATPFDKKSADFLDHIGVDLYKISSFDVTNLPLVEYVAKKGKPIILSLGMSNIEEMDQAIESILQYNNQLILKHCVSIYPTPDERLNLATLSLLKKRYAPSPVGYSGHEKGILPSVSAVALGADSIERHFTLDKSLPGPDHATVSIEPEEFKEMVEFGRRIEKMIGSPIEEVLEEEAKARAKHAKSVVAAVDIAAGTTITPEMLTIKSPGYGIKPAHIYKVIDKKAKVDIPADSVIVIDFIAE